MGGLLRAGPVRPSSRHLQQHAHAGQWPRLLGGTAARKLGVNRLGFVSRAADRFPARRMQPGHPGLRAILERFPRRLLYRFSTGGYGAIRFSRALGAEAVVAPAPQ